MSAVVAPQWLLSCVLLVGLGALLFAILRSAKYGAPISALLTGIALLQPAFWNARISLGAILFAAAVCGVAVAATAFMVRQDARRIALLGGSLAGAQLVHPFWGAAATILLPLALRNRIASAGTGSVTGLYVSILFVPVLTNAVLYSLDDNFRSEMTALGGVRSVPSSPILWAALLPGVPLLGPIAVRRGGLSGGAVFAIAFALVAVCGALAALSRPFFAMTAAFSSLAVVSIADWQPMMRARYAMLLVSTVTAAGWISLWLAQSHG